MNRGALDESAVVASAQFLHTGGVTARPTLYELLGVDSACEFDELRSAYRQRARECHPDVAASGDDGQQMGLLNDAWRVLSDPERRVAYDDSLAANAVTMTVTSPQPPPQAHRSRRDAWVAGVQAQMVRLARLAGRSSVQTLLLRNPRATRSVYDEIVELIIDELTQETEARVRAARAAGTAPLDLGVAATLIGIRCLADRVRRDASLGITRELLMTAELLDRMWDVLAHEVPIELNDSLGGNPHVARVLVGR